MREESTAAAVINRLQTHGTEVVFGIPGTHNLSLYRHLAGSDIRHLVCRHEQSLAFAADGYARASGKPGVVLTTTGPGALNAISAIATSYGDSVPVLLISPGMPTHLESRDAGFLHQVRDQTGAFAAVTGRSRRAANAAEAAELVDQAFNAFTASRPRPVHIEIPVDAMDATATPPAPAPRVVRPVADPSTVREAAELLSGARSAVLLLGGGAVACGESSLELARSLRVPVVTTVNGKGIVDEGDPASLGACLRLPAAHALLENVDVVLAVGTELGESDFWRDPPWRSSSKLIRVDIDPDQLHKNAVAEVALLGDADATIRSLLAAVEAAPDRDRGLGSTEELRAALREQAMIDGAPFVGLTEALSDVLEADAIIAGDSTMACYYGIVHLFAQSAPRRFLYPTGFAPLGYGLPAAIGAKLAHPDRQVVVVIGDGGIMFTLAELATAAELRMPLPVVVVNNAGYGEIRDEMDAAGQPRIGVDIESPDFPAVARALGGTGIRPSNLDGVSAAIQAAFTTPGPTLIEIGSSLLGEPTVD
ncbi:MAG: 5-guanidino-2-oxopentanoate decarboxylase [Actinobacteria bacterium]|nr:5-guanidino-2-oxopentanoate decarboxylase [Actinomycetota bacterium]